MYDEVDATFGGQQNKTAITIIAWGGLHEKPRLALSGANSLYRRHVSLQK